MRRALNPRTLAGRLRNWRNRRFIETGRGFRLERATRRVRASAPVYRDRINPGTGRPRRDDVRVYAVRDRGFARMRESGQFSHPRAKAAAWEHSPDAYRSRPAPGRSR
jgi:hypothetical protein